MADFERGLLSVVIPCYNEIRVLPLLEERLALAREARACPGKCLRGRWIEGRHIERLASLNAEDPRLKLVRLSRNFGHQAAIAAGPRWARGEVVGILDADLQDPPELITTCLTHWREGDQVVYASARSARKAR